MEDALKQLAEIQDLAPREAIFARALIRNGLVAAERVLDAARAGAADLSGGGVLDRLSASGELSEERARKIEEALEKKIAERRRAPAGSAGEKPTEAGSSGPDSGGQKKGPRMWKPRSERHGPSAGESAVVLLGEMRQRRETKSKTEEDIIDAFMGKYVRSQLHQVIIEKFARMKAGVADPRALVQALGVKERRIVRILNDWKAKGLLKTVGGFPFCYDPPPQEKEAAALFLRAWHDPRRHARLISKVLEMEGD